MSFISISLFAVQMIMQIKCTNLILICISYKELYVVYCDYDELDDCVKWVTFCIPSTKKQLTKCYTDP